MPPPATRADDTQFVLSEANANINLWVKADAAHCDSAAVAPLGCANTTVDGAIQYYERRGTFSADPWGDELGTVGTILMTKAIGPVTDECARDEDKEGWTCLNDGADVTAAYKTAEPSDPGTPTACQGLSGELYTSPYCPLVGPFSSSATAGGHRRLAMEGHAQRPDSSQTPSSQPPSSSDLRRARSLNGGSSTLTWAMGLAPQIQGPLVNEPGHSLSNVRVDVVVSRTTESSGSTMSTMGSADVDVSCGFQAIATDYTSAPHFRDNVTGMPDLAASTVKIQPAETATVGEGSPHTFSFSVARVDYRSLAPTYLDTDMTAVPPADAFYALTLTAYCSASDGSSFVRQHSKVLCEPIIATASRSKIVCAAKRGTYQKETADTDALAHLDECAAVGITSDSVNDGHCNLNNNVDGCFDGGDCCSYSCWAKNGHFLQIGADGTHEFAHSCYDLDDAIHCLDSSMVNYAPPADFTVPALPSSFTDAPGAAHAGGVNNCTALAADMAPTLPTCAAMRDSLCHDPVLAVRDCGDALQAAMLSVHTLECSLPRCETTQQQCKCMASWSATYGGETYHGNGCDNPDDDARGEWCVVVHGSCRGPNTKFGLPQPLETGNLDAGKLYDYCGTGTGVVPAWTPQDLQSLARILPDPAPSGNWTPLAVVAASEDGTGDSGSEDTGAVLELTGARPKIVFGPPAGPNCELGLDPVTQALLSTCEVRTPSSSAPSSSAGGASANLPPRPGRRLGTRPSEVATYVSWAEHQALMAEVAALRRLVDELPR